MMGLHKTNGLWIQITHNVPAGEGGGVPLHIPSTSGHWGVEWNSECIHNVGVQIGKHQSESIGSFASDQWCLYRGW